MQELQRKLKTVQDALPADFFVDEEVVGIRIDASGTTITIIARSNQHATLLRTDLASLQPLTAVLQREALTLQIATEDVPKPYAVPAGTAGYGQGLGGYGTLGWFVYLDNILVCVSNHHVLCANGDSTPLGTPVFSGFSPNGTRIGSLHSFDVIGTAQNRMFDFALAAIDDLSAIKSEMAACANGTQYPYPQQLGFEKDLNPANIYYTVGARPPTCAEGRYRGLYTTKVGPYPDGKYYLFSEQLLFDPFTNPGDSGSIVAEKQSARAVGLIFAGSEGVHSIANPLYRKGWTYTGTKAFGDIELPTLRSEAPRIDQLALRPQAGPPNLDTSPLPPIFGAGQILISPKSTQEWLQSLGGIPQEIVVVQPYGQWVEVRVKVEPTPTGGGFGRTARAWIHAPTGITYSAGIDMGP